ncbi:MAG TPA: transcription antitermination factor NusB [Alphaproteobacteria bacterium]|jgi:N utilization substance protein B|nr:transcription antitermination factor NusB [Alphaproteobacteria bacterium]
MTIHVGKRPKTPPKPRSSAKARRTAARLAAVQVLYQAEQAGKSAPEALAEFIEFRIGHEVDGDTFVAADVTLLSAIVRGADAERAHLDTLLADAIRAPLERDRLELLLRVILTAGAWELVRNLETPAAIVIAEYVGVASGFYGGTEPGLINGVLDRLARTARPYEFGVTGAGPIPGGPAAQVKNAD